MTFPEKVKEGRSALGLTQTELGRAVGVSLRMILAYEKGEKYPRRKTVMRLAQALRVSTRYLTDDTCRNPLEDIESDRLREEAEALYGLKGVTDVDELLARNTALFAGGELSQEQKDAFFDAVMTAYVTCKEEARMKFSRKSPPKKD